MNYKVTGFRATDHAPMHEAYFEAYEDAVYWAEYKTVHGWAVLINDAKTGKETLHVRAT